MDATSAEIQSMAVGILYLVVAAVLLVIAMQVMRWQVSYKLDRELTSRDNKALGLSLSGYLLGVLLIFLGASLGPDNEEARSWGHILAELGIDLAYALMGIAMLSLARLLVDRLLLVEFSTRKEIITDHNLGTGAVEFGAYIGSALIIAGAIHGEAGGALTALIFFVLGQASLILFGRFYQFMTSYDIHAEIERDNVAAGTALGLNLIAMSIVVLKGSAATFESWKDNLLWFGIDVALGFVALLLIRKMTDLLVLPGASLDHEIAEDQNLSAAWIEGAIAIGFAALIYSLL